jgi:hypothetical protein
MADIGKVPEGGSDQWKDRIKSAHDSWEELKGRPLYIYIYIAQRGCWVFEVTSNIKIAKSGDSVLIF